MKSKVILGIALLILIFLSGQNDLMALKGPRPQRAHPWGGEEALTPISTSAPCQNVFFLIPISNTPFVIYIEPTKTLDVKLQKQEEVKNYEGKKNEGARSTTFRKY